MQININDLPELLTDLIKKSGKTKQQIQDAVGLSNSTLSRLCNRRHGMQKSTAKVLNDYFEVPYFVNYQIKDGVCVHSDVIVQNNKRNKFNPGDTVMNLFNRNIFMVTEIKFNKATQEWMYKHNNEWVEELYIKGVNLEPKSNEIKEEKEMKIIHEPLFEIPQIEVTPEETIKDSIEKINDKDSIKSILKDVITRLIELL